MTEMEWNAGTDPDPMLDFLGPRISQRKVRLLACGCVRLGWRSLTDLRSRRAVEVAERYAEGMASREDVEVAQAAAYRAAREGYADEAYAAAHAADASAWSAAARASDWVDRPVAEAALVRELWGNPFRPVQVDPAWLCRNGGTVRELSQAISDHGRFDDLPVLADALEEAGCQDADILGHLRLAGQHFRGCWVLDLLTGRK